LEELQVEGGRAGDGASMMPTVEVCAQRSIFPPFRFPYHCWFCIWTGSDKGLSLPDRKQAVL